MNAAGQAAEVYLEAAKLNREDPLLTGSLLTFPDYGQVVMTGDLHGHRRNFEKLQRYCDLEHLGARHVVLHEIIHEEVETIEGLIEEGWPVSYPQGVGRCTVSYHHY